MLAAVISAIVFLALFSAYIYAARNIARINLLQKQTTQGGRILIQFTRDINAAERIGLTATSGGKILGTPTATTLAMRIVSYNSVDPKTPILSTVVYAFSSDGGNPVRYALTRSENLGTPVEIYAVSLPSTQTPPGFELRYYDKKGLPFGGSSTEGIKGVEYSFRMVAGNPSNGTQSVYTMVSPRLLVRNRLPPSQ
jgi:hypothetical protein